MIMKIRKKLGRLKNDLNGCVMSEMLRLNRKDYAFKYQHIEKKQRLNKNS